MDAKYRGVNLLCMLSFKIFIPFFLPHPILHSAACTLCTLQMLLIAAGLDGRLLEAVAQRCALVGKGCTGVPFPSLHCTVGWLLRAQERRQAPPVTVLCAGEQLLRKSGVPYTIVRPAGLTNEPAGRAQLVAGAARRLAGADCALCMCLAGLM